jgi:hypothetical protein
MNPTTVPRNALVSRFDADPGPWRPMFYGLKIQVPLEEGGSESAAVTIQNQPFIWMWLGHQIIGNTWYEDTGLRQDGQYNIEFKDELSNYQNIPVAASAAFGGGEFGYGVNLPVPIAYPGAKTITFRITNEYTRVLTPTPDEPVFTIKLVLGGVADWGELQP